jgi:hypothetical protein
MRDWLKELPPGTMLFHKSERVFALVIQVRIEHLPAGWERMQLLVLSSSCQLQEFNFEASNFYDQWYKVLT